MEKTRILAESTKYNPQQIADNLSLPALEKSYGEYEVELKRLEKEKALLHDAILLKMEFLFGHQVKAWTNPDTGGTLSRSLPVTTEINQPLIKKLVTSKQYAVISDTKVVLSKLKAAITAQVVNPRIIAKAIQTTEVDKLQWFPRKGA
jgi:hypothetical protein